MSKTGYFEVKKKEMGNDFYGNDGEKVHVLRIETHQQDPSLFTLSLSNPQCHMTSKILNRCHCYVLHTVKSAYSLQK